MKAGEEILVLPKLGNNGKSFSKWNTGIFVLLFYFYLGLYGCVYGILSVFPVPYDQKMLFWGILCIGIVHLIFYFLGKWRAIWLPSAAVLYVWMIYYNFAKLKRTMAVLGQIIRELIKSSGNINFDINALDIVSRQEAATSLLLIIFLLAGILFWGTIVNEGRTIGLISTATVLGIALALGTLPATLPLCMMGLFLIGTFSTVGLCNVSAQRMSGITMGLVSVVLFAVGHFLVVPILSPYFANEESIKVRIQNISLIRELSTYLPQWQGDWARGGIGNGEISNAEMIINTNEEALEVTLYSQPVDTIYLKCYTGSIYTGSEWKPVADPIQEQVAAAYYQLFQGAASIVGGNETTVLEIEVKGAPEEYRYQPYFSKLQKHVPKKYRYQYYYQAEVDTWYENNVLFRGDELFSTYQNFVEGNYLKYPKERLARLEEQCRQKPLEDLNEIKAYIVTMLDESAAYNLQVGAFPSDCENAEYFLYEKKEGYCVHFATVATLMFRMYGIPARYVTGYIVPADDFQNRENYFTARVTGARAHAWTEIYVDGKGWEPVEVTPGYTKRKSDFNSEQESDTPDTKFTEQKETKQEETKQEETNINQSTVNQKKFAKWLPVLIGIVVLFGFFGIRRRVILRNNRKKDVRELFYDMYAMLVWVGLPEECDCEAACFGKIVKERFPWIDSEAFSIIMELVMRANFGDRSMTEEEIKTMHEMYQSICSHVYRKLSLKKRFVFRFIRVYY